MSEEVLFHTLKPVFDLRSRVLILGSFPSPLSRSSHFYYGNPYNRFWRVIAKVTNEEVPTTIEEKKNLLFKHNIALWDVIASCTIEGASDSSIKDVKVNDISFILKNSQIEKIYANGSKAFELYQKYIYQTTSIKAIKLPSTSPANCSFSEEKLVFCYSVIVK